MPDVLKTEVVPYVHFNEIRYIDLHRLIATINRYHQSVGWSYSQENWFFQATVIFYLAIRDVKPSCTV